MDIFPFLDHYTSIFSLQNRYGTKKIPSVFRRQLFAEIDQWITQKKTIPFERKTLFFSNLSLHLDTQQLYFRAIVSNRLRKGQRSKTDCRLSGTVLFMQESPKIGYCLIMRKWSESESV